MFIISCSKMIYFSEPQVVCPYDFQRNSYCFKASCYPNNHQNQQTLLLHFFVFTHLYSVVSHAETLHFLKMCNNKIILDIVLCIYCILLKNRHCLNHLLKCITTLSLNDNVWFIILSTAFQDIFS